MHEYQHLSMDEDELIHQQPGLWLRRSLVIALYLSFFACLAAIWLTGTLLGSPDHFLSPWLLLVVVDHRVVVLVVPFVCLIVCYGALRRLTGEIMAVPERYLDERQKAMRDQAHRSAFKIIKLSCLVIPALLLAQYLPRFHRTSQLQSAITYYPPAFFTSTWNNTSMWTRIEPPKIVHIIPVQVSAPASSTEVALAGAILLLCLFLLFSTLPMSVLAWKGKV